MNKVLSFIKLDFITVKPYLTLKNLVIFIAVAFIVTMNFGDSASIIGILMVYAALYVTYPFAVGEKNGIDALYITLSIKRNIVVLGRYLFALIINISSGLIAYVISFAILTVMGKEFKAKESLLIILVMFFVYSVLQAVQLPIFFKLGYTKAKFLSYLPFVGFPLVIFLFSNFLNNSSLLSVVTGIFEWFVANPLIAILAGIFIWLIIMVVSYQFSYVYYNKRDF